MSKRERAVVIFPGRGSYAAGELGYLRRHHADAADMVARLDTLRQGAGADSVAALDAMERFSPSRHLPGRNASNLIYTAALADYAAIDRDRYDIVAVCGNSLGWYLSLAGAGALSLEDGARLVDRMGATMEADGVGGQILYPVAGEDWRIDPARRDRAMEAVARTDNAYLSIDLGGTLVLAGDKAALAAMQSILATNGEDAPVQLPKHAAFHTPLLSHVPALAQGALPAGLFDAPDIPMIDGRGMVWSPWGTDVSALYRYTLETQIMETYDFAKSVEVACKEFAPDRLILAGPGSTLGAPIAQTLIALGWHGLASRADFMQIQQADPFLLAMGRSEQRGLAVAR